MLPAFLLALALTAPQTPISVRVTPERQLRLAPVTGQPLRDVLAALEPLVAAQLTADEATGKLPITLEGRPLSPERLLLSLARQTSARLVVRYCFLPTEAPAPRERRLPLFLDRTVTTQRDLPLTLAAFGSRQGLLFEGPDGLPPLKLRFQQEPLSRVLDTLAKRTQTRWEVRVRLEGGAPAGRVTDDATRYDRLQRDFQGLVQLSDSEREQELSEGLTRALGLAPVPRAFALEQLTSQLEGVSTLYRAIPDEHRERLTPLYQCLAQSYQSAFAPLSQRDQDTLAPVRRALDALLQQLR